MRILIFVLSVKFIPSLSLPSFSNHNDYFGSHTHPYGGLNFWDWGPLANVPSKNVFYGDTFDPQSHPNWHLLPPKDKCGGNTHEEKIIGGTEVSLGHVPWIAAIGYRTGSSHGPLYYACGGSLISKYYVLTAAHCVDGPEGDVAEVRLGEHNTKTNPDCEMRGRKVFCAPPVQDIPVVRIIQHERFNVGKSMRNDIGLLKLKYPPTLNPFVQPACLPFGLGMNMDFTGLDTEVAGWGYTEDHHQSTVLLAVTQQVFDKDECQIIYFKNDIDVSYNNGQICVGGKVGKDSCSGDSGGPLTYRGVFDTNIGVRTYLIGLVSHGPLECGYYEVPGVYSRTSYFMNWILDHIEE